MCWQVIDLTECFVCMPNITLVTMKVYDIKTPSPPPPPHTGLHSIWATGLLLYISGKKVEMEDFWAGAFWALMIWLYLIIGLIMIPAMCGFSLGISETYMTILVRTLEVLLFLLLCFRQILSTTGPWLSPACPPLLQWATLKMQKANADERTLKASASNGE